MYNRTGGPVGPFLLCSHTETKGGEGRLKGRGVHHRNGERGVGPVSMGPGRTQAGSSSGEGGTLPGPRPGHSIDIPDTGSPVMHGWVGGSDFSRQYPKIGEDGCTDGGRGATNDDETLMMDHIVQPHTQQLHIDDESLTKH